MARLENNTDIVCNSEVVKISFKNKIRIKEVEYNILSIKKVGLPTLVSDKKCAKININGKKAGLHPIGIKLYKNLNLCILLV